MKERPMAANTVLSRLRRPVGRLRDTPIWAKLGLIMIVPTVATVVVGLVGLAGHIDTARNADRARSLANLSQVAGQLVHDLQNEHAAAAMLLASRDQAAQSRNRTTYLDSHEAVDAAKRPYSQQRNALSGLPNNFRQLLEQIDNSLSDLPAVRSQVLNSKLRLSEAENDYQALLSTLISIRDSASQLAGETTLSDRMRAAAEISRIKDHLSERRVVVHQILNQGKFTSQLRNAYISTQTGQDQARVDFERAATREERSLYEQTVAGSVLRKAETYQGYLNSKGDANLADAPFDAAEWDAAMREQADLLRTVEAKLDADMVEQAIAVRDDAQQRVLVQTGILLGALLLGILFAWLVARSMARSLRELRHGALSIAQSGLPQAVARLRDPSLSTQLSPAQVATQIAEPLPVRSKDEFGQVTEAFNAVHLEAVRTAAEQAALRSSVSTMFVNLARRSQILVDRLIGHLDRLERGEEDPDRLAELFQLDHLATRMRRNDENLLVLAGADSTRVQREPAALIDVLRAAQSEVEHYTRIEFGVVDRDIEIAAHAVNDLVHLVAELFDNATAFSPPDSHVVVEARRVGDRAVLYVEDRGIGITPEQLADLNERLATPPMVDVAVSRMMGLVVVARLGSRHGVKVELRPAAERGTIADVTLPTSVLVPRGLPGRMPAAGGLPLPHEMTSPGQRPASAPPRSPFGPPLALESGPAAAGRPPEPQSGPPGIGGRPFEPARSLNGGGLFGPGDSTRGLPAWSDLTGATPPNGNDAFVPRTPNGQRSVTPLPQRRATEQPWPGTVDGEVTGGAPPSPPHQTPVPPEARGPVAPRELPPPAAPSPPVVSAPPFPAAFPVPAPFTVPSPPGVPTPPPPVPEGTTAPPSLPPGAAPPPVVPAGSAPPAWPPVAPERESTPPPVPEKFAAALDMTAEIPKVRPDASTSAPAGSTPAMAGPAGAKPPAVKPPPAQARRFIDETMELPIFRELESAWFRTRRPVPEAPPPEPTAAPAGPQAEQSTAQLATLEAGRVASVQQDPTGTTGSSMANTPMAGGAPRGTGPGTAAGTGQGVGPGRGDTPGGWETAADEGWRAATAAADVQVEETTQAGLPKRVPMAQLVPGGVDKEENSVQRRTPEGVRGLLSAYHRGVQRGRAQPKDDRTINPQPTPAGQQSSQAGKEHEG
ncbi:MAG TPA: nitrate- and nitrite sensing domain-containing protein [Pilimelia sp.]|nr:nitrate- and nitrite sensing domain-containing protein [Pilimelia sp.]